MRKIRKHWFGIIIKQEIGELREDYGDSDKRDTTLGTNLRLGKERSTCEWHSDGVIRDIDGKPGASSVTEGKQEEI